MVDDPYTRYRHDDLRGRTIDTLIGISKGIIADGKVNQAEAEALLSFLVESDMSWLDHPMMDRLVDRVGDMLQDGVLDDEEARELHDLLASFSGGVSTWGEISKPATLPLDDPPPSVVFDARPSCSPARSYSAPGRNAIKRRDLEVRSCEVRHSCLGLSRDRQLRCGRLEAPEFRHQDRKGDGLSEFQRKARDYYGRSLDCTSKIIVENLTWII